MLNMQASHEGAKIGDIALITATPAVKEIYVKAITIKKAAQVATLILFVDIF